MEIDKKVVNEYFKKMAHLVEEKVGSTDDIEQKKKELEKLKEMESKWLEEHPGCPRYFSPSNGDSEIFSYNFPDESKIPCSNCMFAKKDDPTNAFCKVYRYPNLKPDNVLWGKHPQCEYQVELEKTKKEN